MTEPSREAQVLGAVVTLVDSLLDDFDVVDLLTELTENCVQLLDVATAGLLLADPHSRLHLLAATSEATHDLELFQLQSDEGPCLDCYTSGRPVSVADLAAARTRWPRFAHAAAGAGFASVHAVPMRAAGTVIGALGLFGTSVGELSGEDRLLAQTLAHVACVAILSEHAPTSDIVGPQLRAALGSRIVVERAKGFIHESLSVPMTEAFVLLRRYAHGQREHLTEVARRLLTAREDREAILSAMQRM